MHIPAPAPEGESPADAPGPLPGSSLTSDRPVRTRPTIATLRATGNGKWSDWRWQMSNRIRTVTQLRKYVMTLSDPTEMERVISKYPMAITPYYASLIREPTLADPVFQMAVPQARELWDPAFLSDDPLEEEEDMPVRGLVHRYPDRALLLATTTCATYCRHCTRKRVAGTRECAISAARMQAVVEYLAQHPEISDVIISGGDPLTLSTASIEHILSSLRSVPSVEIIRIGTRAPVTLPQRITDELVQTLRKYQPVWVSTHFNHPHEVTEESIEACARLIDAGIPVNNQTVLLRGINDNPQTMEQLCRSLVRARVRPYYLFQCDLVRGVEHLRTPLSRGIEIMEYLRGRLSGFAIPLFVVDAPHGGGKIPVLPNYLVSASPTHTVLRNFEGMMVNYPEPQIPPEPSKCPLARSTAPGVWEVATGKSAFLAPHDSLRQHRREERATVRLARTGNPL